MGESKLRRFFTFVALLIALSAQLCFAGEDLITTAREGNGEIVPYVLNYANLSPKYVIILFPGGDGIVDPHMDNGELVYGHRDNFLLRARPFIVDDEFVTVTTNSTQLKERIQAVIDDLKRRFPTAQIYLMGTSNGTYDTVALADYLSDRISGEIHTSSLQQIASFDARKYRNRHLIVHHRDDSCRRTPFGAANVSRDRYGNDFIAMQGGVSRGDPCKALAYHGYNGIERETIDAIKKWIKQDS